jgi:hypothetical protein
MTGDHDDFWSEADPAATARHAREPRSARRAMSLAKLGLLVGLVTLAAAICGFYGLIPRTVPAAISQALTGSASVVIRRKTSPEPTKSAQRLINPSPSQRPTPASPKPKAKPKPKSAEPPPPRPAPTTVSVAPPSGPVELALGAHFNNIGITSNAAPTHGNLDGAQAAFSFQALAAHGVRPGVVITYDGIPFVWPDVAAGKPDNVTASGQTLTVREAGTRLDFLLTATWGPAKGTATVVYSGGSTQKFTIGAPDWTLSCQSGAPDVVAYTPYRNMSTGRDADAACVYYASIRLRSVRSVTSIILPYRPPQPWQGRPSLHIFAITIS